MYLKKVLVNLTAGLLTVLLLAGCGGSKANNEKSDSEQKTGSEDQTMVGNMYKTGLPIVKDKVTIKAVFALNPQHGKLEEMAFFKNLEEKTNVHIEWNAIPQANIRDKNTMMIAGGDLPDIFYGTAAFSPEDISKYAPQGVIIPLDKLIEDYAPNIKATFAKRDDFKKVCMLPDDGKIYSIGRLVDRETNSANINMFMYKPWLDKLGLSVPQTTDDFYNVLKAFKEKDPNGNGKQDEVPYSFVYKHPLCGYYPLFGSFGRVDWPTNTTGLSSHVVEENGKVVFTADKPEYKEAIKFYSKFFKEGLFDKEGFTAKDQKGLISMGNSQDVTLGSFMAFLPQGNVKPEREKDYVPVAPLKGPDGKQVWIKNTIGNAGRAGFVITSANKNPEIAMRWIDQHFDKQTSIEAFLGPVDVNLKKGANGMLDYISTPQGQSYTEFRMKNAPVHTALAILNEDWNKNVKIMDEDVDKLEVVNKYYKPYLKNSNFANYFTESEAQFFASTGKDICEYVDQMQAKWMMEGTIEQDWDAYLAKLKQLKLDDYVKNYENVYKRLNTK